MGEIAGSGFFLVLFVTSSLISGSLQKKFKKKVFWGGYTGDLRKSGQKTERVRECVCVDRGSRFVPFTQLVWYIIWSKFSLPLSDMYGLLGRRAFLRAAFVLGDVGFWIGINFVICSIRC